MAKRLGAFLLLVIYIASCIQFGRWQLHRLDERRAWNANVTSRLTAEPIAASTLFEEIDVRKSEWRRVTFTGTFDAEQQTLIRGRYNQGRYGYEVVTPMVAVNGPALLVDRGWIPAGKSATTPPDIPAPPSGIVSIEGRVRIAEGKDRPGPNGAIIGLPSRAANRIVPTELARDLPYKTFNAYVEMTAPSTQLPIQLAAPQLGEGPHLAYAFQWFFFAALGLFGPFIYRRMSRQTS